MSSPSTTAGGRAVTPGTGAAKPPPIAALAHARDIAAGQPVADLPQMIEPVAELSMKRRPPRRRFLAQTAPTTRIARPRKLDLREVPQIVEPLPAPSATERPQPAPAASPAPRPRIRLPAPATRWLALARGRLPPLPADRRTRLAVLAAGGVVALGLLAVAATLAGYSPLSRAPHYPVSAAPSDPARRLAYFQEGAQAGDAGAQLQLAILYAKGEGVAQDYTTAATWFRAAANQGLPRAQYDMGVLTERGRGVKVDLAEAAGWYQKAAQAGYPLAQYNLAVCYTKGQGIRQDLPEAALWYRRAATQGVVLAMVNLATMYDKGEGVTGSPVDAYAWYLAAGRRDNQAAARRAQDMFASLPHLDQIRAEALASDIAASIHDPDSGDRPDASGAAKH